MIDIDAKQLQRLAADAKRAVPGLEKEFQQSLAAAGELVAVKARQKANAFPGKKRTTRLADSVKTRRRGTRVKIQAGGDSAPHAAAMENQGNQGNFRHPVFGNFDNWVDQPAHPFLTPAAEESADDVERAVLRAVDITVARLVS